jgi:type VI secretion system protein ImpM
MPAAFGAYGKMPSLGDFFRISLPADFVAAWDVWLQGGLTAVRAALDGAWQDCYMSAPIWRFTLGPGLAGKSGMLGVLMPSVDRVGRMFPLTIAAPLGDGRSPFLDHFLAGSAFAELERVALAALEDTMTREALAERIAAVTCAVSGSGARVALADGTLTVSGAGAWGPLPDLAASLLIQRFPRPSVWSAEVAGSVRLMACDGLPDASRLRGLFDLDAPVWSPGGRAAA